MERQLVLNVLAAEWGDPPMTVYHVELLDPEKMASYPASAGGQDALKAMLSGIEMVTATLGIYLPRPSVPKAGEQVWVFLLDTRETMLGKAQKADYPHLYVEGGDNQLHCDRKCGAVVGSSQSSSPTGVDPFGDCPQHPEYNRFPGIPHGGGDEWT